MTNEAWIAHRVLAAAVLVLMGAGTQRSGYDDASPETRAMQDDDNANPAFLWVKQGETLWSNRLAPPGNPAPRATAMSANSTAWRRITRNSIRNVTVS